jgi:hypothetical protein
MFIGIMLAAAYVRSLRLRETLPNAVLHQPLGSFLRSNVVLLHKIPKGRVASQVAGASCLPSSTPLDAMINTPTRLLLCSVLTSFTKF